MLKRCPRCGEFHGAECNALEYFVWIEEQGEDSGDVIIAWNKTGAAKKFAAEYDAQSASYRFVTEGGVLVVRRGTMVVRDEHDKPARFFVEGEAVPQYYVREIKK